MEGPEYADRLHVGAGEDGRGPVCRGKEALAGRVTTDPGERAARYRPFGEAGVLEGLQPPVLTRVPFVACGGTHGQADVGVAVPDQVLHGGAGSFSQVHAHRGETCGPLAVAQEHGRYLRGLQVSQIRVQEHTRQDHAIHLPGGEVPDIPALLGQVPVRVRQEQCEAQFCRRVLHCMGQEGEEGVAVVRNDEADSLR